MADRYWVGGTANWDGTAGTKWATTSGGAGGAAVPTSADDVFFDAASAAVTCTISAGNTGAKSINCTGFTGTLTGSTAITVSGSITLVAAMTYTHSGAVTINGTGTITSAGKGFGANFTINGVGVTVDLGDAFGTNGTFTVTQGTFTTNNYAVTVNGFGSNNSNVRAINLGSSTFTVTQSGSVFFIGTNTNLTFNAGTSTIIFTSTGPNLSGGAAGGTGLTFYNVSFTNTSAGTRTISSTNTFNNLAITAPSSAGVTQLTFDSNQTINGTFSTTGTAGNRRVWFRSDTYGVRRTLTVNSAPSLTDADFRDIIVNGTSAPISGTRIGNRGQCTGITFDAPKTVYWNLAGAQNWSANGWAPTSGGTPNTDNFPLPQDTAVFNNTGSVTGTITVNANSLFLSSVDMSNRTSAMTISVSADVVIYGSWTNGSGTTASGGFSITFEGQGTKTITSAGKSLDFSIGVNAYGGSVELADAISASLRSLIVSNGTFKTNGFSASFFVLSANNTNVKTIDFGSSTVTLSTNNTPITVDATNSTLNFSSSTINFTGNIGSNTQTFGNGVTYGTVNFTGSSTTPNISGTATFNNLTINAPSSTGFNQLVLLSNITVTGTLTCAGATAIRRIFLRSNTQGATRTITANAISATDCNFQDITIAGSAAGSSPTRASDCGGNTGITFPAPKTVYRVGVSTSWFADAWAATSGGAADINNYPLAQDTAVFNDSTTGATLSLTSGVADAHVGTVDFSTRTTAFTANFNGTVLNTYKDFTLSAAVTTTGGNGGPNQPPNFAGRNLMLFTSGGATNTLTISVNALGGTVRLNDALNTTGGLGLGFGTFDANNYNVTIAGFDNLNNSSVRTLQMGSGLWTLTSTGDVWRTNNITNLNFQKGTANILLSNTSGTARTFTGGGLSFNKLTIGGATGTSNTTIAGSNQFTELASTKTVAHTVTFTVGTTQTIGTWSITGTLGNVVTIAPSQPGFFYTISIAGSAPTGIDYLSITYCSFSPNSPAEFFVGANSTNGIGNTNVTFTATPAARTLYWVGGTGNWSDTARWSLSSGGAGGEAVPRSTDDVVFDSASNATAYTATVNAITSGNRCNQLTIAGPASGNVTLAGSTTLFIHGNVTLPATGLTRTYTGAFALSGSTTGKTFTTNGVTLASNISVFGVGCGWTLGSALNNGSSSIFVTYGTFDTGNYNITNGAISSSNSNSRTISLGSSTLNLSGSVSFDTSINLTFNAGTSQLNLSDANASINAGISGGSGQTFYNVSFTNTNIGTVTFSGTNTFNNLTIAGRTFAGLANLSINANQTINGTLTLSAGTNATMRTFVRSNTIGTTRTLTCNAVSATDIDFRDITIAGTAAPVSGTRLGDCGGNTGITFPAAKTVYFALTSGTNWNSTSAWSFTDGGASDSAAFPLAQDTAVFTSSRPNSGQNVIINQNHNIGTIDMSARTSNTMTLSTGVILPIVYGNWINGTGTTLSGTNIITFSGRGSQTITSAGRTFTNSIAVDTPSGTVQLDDALTANGTITLTRGTLDAVSYNLTCAAFSSNNSNVRTIDMGSGLWTLSGTGTVWDVSLTNITFNKETADILLSNTTTTARTFSGGGNSYNKLTIGGATGVSTLTVNGNNTFTEIASTKTVAHTIALGTTTQRVGAFTVTGTAGNVVSITGNTSNMIYTASGNTSAIDYLNVQGRAYGSAGQMTGVWYAGANSINTGSLGWVFEAGTPPPPPPVANANFFLLFA